MLRETNATEILAARTIRLRKETGNQDLRSATEKTVEGQRLVERALLLPFRILAFSPIVTLIAIYVALIFGIYYLFFATFPTVFEDTYHWSVEITGLAYLGIGVGCFTGLTIIARTSDRLYATDSSPERRLIPMIRWGPIVPVGIFIYAWATQCKSPLLVT